MHTRPELCDATAAPHDHAALADLLAAREPAREARRLLTFVCAVSRRPPLDRDLCTALAVRSHAEAVCAAVGAALGADTTAAALAQAAHAGRALVHLRAVLHVAHADGLLHPVQLEILAAQAARTRRAIVELHARAAALGAAGRRAAPATVRPAGRAPA